MELKETKLSSETVYDGKIIKVQKDTVELPNGKEAVREVSTPFGRRMRMRGGWSAQFVFRAPIPLSIRGGNA